MSKKMGRPPLPKGQSKGELFALKVSAKELKIIDDAVKQSGLSKADWSRAALTNASRPVWVICDKWGAADLRGKTVQFEFKTKDGFSYYKGLGIFWITVHQDEVQLAIAIHAGPPEGRLVRLVLNQQLADAIERHAKSSVADFCCFATVESLQCHC